MTALPPATESTPTWAADLSLRERRFVQEYVVDLNGRAAGVRAGLGGNPKSAGEMAAKLRAKPHVAAAISSLMNEQHGVAGARIISELGAIAYSRMSDIVQLDEKGRLVLKVKNLDELPDEAKAAIVKLKERHNEDGTITIEVELADKLVALTRLGQAVTLFKEADVNHRHKHEVEIVDPKARIMERLAALKKALDAEAPIEVEPPVRRPQLPRAAANGNGSVIDVE
jgi:phage terminase small subunit